MYSFSDLDYGAWYLNGKDPRELQQSIQQFLESKLNRGLEFGVDYHIGVIPSVDEESSIIVAPIAQDVQYVLEYLALHDLSVDRLDQLLILDSLAAAPDIQAELLRYGYHALWWLDYDINKLMIIHNCLDQEIITILKLRF